MKKLQKIHKFSLIIFVVILLDQLTKFLIKPLIIIPDVLHFTLAQNTGAAFSIFTGNNFLLSSVTAIVIAMIIYYYKKIPKQELFYWALITGGALGNLIDRLLFGYVRDFIDFRIWPIFNLADSFIVVGIILLILQEIRQYYSKRRSLNS